MSLTKTMSLAIEKRSILLEKLNALEMFARDGRYNVK